jgi:DNA/RNA endonuclease YhcR with UshA esterase domain
MKFQKLCDLSSLFFILIITVCFFSCGDDEKNSEYVDEKEPVKQEIKKESTSEKVDSSRIISDELSSGKNDKPKLKDLPVVAVISPMEAEDYEGKMVTVKGFVADIYRSEKVAYLNFVKKYPDNPFTAVIFARSFADFPDLDKYMNKEVEVTGIISKYKSKPQIILNSPDKLKMK